LDLESVWAGDPELAIGEWAGHTYGTALYGDFIRRPRLAAGADPLRVRFYALLANLTVFVYAATQNVDASGGPWGSPFSFASLMDAHAGALLQMCERAPEHLLVENSAWDGAWAAKTTRDSAAWTTDLVGLTGDRAVAGITRAGGLTDLDRTQVHVCQTVRPPAQADAGTFTIFSGSGDTAIESEVRATAEAIERFCAERSPLHDDDIVVASYRQLAATDSVVHPSRFNLPPDVSFDEEETLEWMPAVELTTGRRHYVPANTVFYPYAPNAGRALFRYFTTGLGAGLDYVSAVAHGLGEVIERDAAALNRILRNRPVLDLATVRDPAIVGLLDTLRGAGLQVIVRHISPADIGVPVFSVILDDPDLRDPMFVCGGYGAHPNRSVALGHALQEAAQSRAGTISGAREDLGKFELKASTDYESFRKRYAYWFTDRTGTCRFDDIPTHDYPTALDDAAHMWNALRRAGFDLILAVHLFRPDVRLRVVKALVPGIERYAFRMRCVGDRARRGYQDLYGRPLRVT
jgi:ribosomal protein S12 methylthiotransferase accessory factor